MSLVRTIVGFLLAPIVPAALVVIFSDLGNSIFVALFEYPAVLVLGVPVHLILQKQRWCSWSAYIIAGSLVGAFSELLYRFTAVVDVYLSRDVSWKGEALEASAALVGDPVPLLLVAYLGAVGALTFWLIVYSDMSRIIRRAG